MKDFIIYLQSRNPTPPEEKKYSLEEIKKLPFSSSLEELKYVKEGELTFIRETKYLNIFNFYCVFQLPRPKAAESVEYTKMNIELYQQKEGNIVISFDAPKKLSKIAAAFLSYVTFGDFFSIKEIHLERSNFLKLKNFVLTGGGSLRQLIFSNSRSKEGEANINQFRLSGRDLEKIPEFSELLNRFSKIRLLGFSFKSANCRDILFRVIEWGGGQFYSPVDPLDHEIGEFLNLFNHILTPEEGTKK